MTSQSYLRDEVIARPPNPTDEVIDMRVDLTILLAIKTMKTMRYMTSRY